MSASTDDPLRRLASRPEPTDMALYAREIAAHLAAMAGAAGLIGLAALFRAAANEAADSLQRLAALAVDDDADAAR